MRNFAILTAAALLATTVGAAAQSSTDSRGNAMGSERVGNMNNSGKSGSGAMQNNSGMSGSTTGSNMGANGANHPTPSSTQGDVGPGGNNNGTRTR